jgi:general secretion pathway protein D
MRSIAGGRSFGALIVICSVILLGCSEVSPAPEQIPSQPPGALQPAAPRINSEIPGDRNRLPVVEARGSSPAPSQVPPAADAGTPQSGDITLNFVDTDIREIVRVVLGTTLKVNYTIDPGVQGTASLEVGRPISRPALLSTLETLLNQNGATLVQHDGVYRVTTTAVGAATNVASGPGAVGAGTEVFVLRYASAKDLAKVLEPYVAEGGKVAPAPGRNALIVSGSPQVRAALIGLIKVFDVDVLAGQSYALFPAGDSSPEKLAAEFEKFLRSEAEGPLAGVVRIVPLQRANAVLIASAQPRYIDAARRFMGLEHRVEDATTRTWHIYYVRNGQSADLEALLQRAFTPGHVSPTPALPGSTAPGSSTANASGFRNGQGASGSSLGQTTGSSSGLGSTASTGAATPPAPPADAPSLATAPLGGPGGPGDQAVENRVRILANRRNNALLIYATPVEYSVIEGMLRKIDIIPLQVMIEATIAEVTLNDQLNYGTEFFLGNKLSAVLTQGSSPSPGVSTTTGGVTTTTNGPGTIGTIAGQALAFGNNFPGFVLTNGVRETINALAAVTQVKVLSAPQVMVLDNEPARLQVGSLVPVLTQSQQSTAAANAPIVNSIDYRDTGVIMLVTPQVNSGGLVTLDISQEVSDVAQATTGNIESPTFDQRLIRTRVAVQDGQTIGMAGLIRDSDSQSNSGIPFFKDIPVLGSLLSSQQNNRTRTELLVLITPHVVHDQRDVRTLTDDLRTQLPNAATVPQALQNRRPSGSHNPNGI